MSHPAINTKVERVVEAFENLAIQAARCTMTRTASALDDVKDAREEAATSLREFLQPTLRVIGPQKEVGPNGETASYGVRPIRR